jgi:hypothetical protein
LEKRGKKLNKNRDLKKYGKKRQYKLNDIYEILKRIYFELSRGKYRSKSLGKTMRSFPRYRSIKKATTKPYQKTPNLYSGLPKQYNPKLRTALSWSGGKPWTEPKHYEPKERIVYDPEVKNLLQKIEKHLKDALENENLEQMDIDELLTSLEDKYDRGIYEKLLEKQLEEINEAEPEPKLYELSVDDTRKDTEPSKIEDVEKLGDENEEKIKPLEKGVELSENSELNEIQEMIMRENEAYLEEHKDELIEKLLIGDMENPETRTDGDIEQIESETVEVEAQNEIDVSMESEASVKQMDEATQEALEITEPASSPEPSLEIGSLYEEVLADPHLWPELEPEKIEPKLKDAEPAVEQTGV